VTTGPDVSRSGVPRILAMITDRRALHTGERPDEEFEGESEGELEGETMADAVAGDCEDGFRLIRV